jgi:hypothetical protein
LREDDDDDIRGHHQLLGGVVMACSCIPASSPMGKP